MNQSYVVTYPEEVFPKSTEATESMSRHGWDITNSSTTETSSGSVKDKKSHQYNMISIARPQVVHQNKLEYDIECQTNKKNSNQKN